MTTSGISGMLIADRGPRLLERGDDLASVLAGRLREELALARSTAA
jgi:hypothetical protein